MAVDLVDEIEGDWNVMNEVNMPRYSTRSSCNGVPPFTLSDYDFATWLAGKGLEEVDSGKIEEHNEGLQCFYNACVAF